MIALLRHLNLFYLFIYLFFFFACKTVIFIEDCDLIKSFYELNSRYILDTDLLLHKVSLL